MGRESPGLCRWAQYHHKVLMMEKDEGQSESEEGGCDNRGRSQREKGKCYSVELMIEKGLWVK